MIMTLIAITLGISILVVAKAVLSWLLSLSLFKVTQWYRFCCDRRDHYRAEQRHQKAVRNTHFSFGA